MDEMLTHRLFEAQALRTPHALAAVCGRKSLTYAALNAAANRLARHLHAQNVRSGDFVVILADRSLQSLTALLASMKIGAVFVPLDLAFPPARIFDIVRSSGAKAILADEKGLRRLQQPDSGVAVTIIHLGAADVRAHSGENHDCPISGLDPVYCIYTSGSTGSPKGVLVHQRGLCNYVDWASRQYLSSSVLRFGLVTSLAFDLTLTSIFAPLIRGGCVYIYPESGLASLAIESALRDNRVDILKLTPSHLSLIANLDVSGSRLKVLILGGEDLKAQIALQAQRQFAGGVRIFNEYGPTETVVGCTVHEFDPDADTRGSVPIGRAIKNMHVYLLDHKMQPVPHGAVGELYIGGVGVALGYRNLPELTRKRFIPDPFVSGASVYATGDLARYDSRGNLVYLGRTDEQVKVAGHRIELGEIEKHLMAYPGVEQCVVNPLRQPLIDVGKDQLIYCSRCGLASNFPNTTYDEQSVCNHCRAYERYRAVVGQYFRSMDDLKVLIGQIKSSRTAPYDCLVAVSGGKDSIYALCKMVELGAKPLAITLDPGYLSDTAKRNIAHVTGRLDVEHRYLTTAAMKEIFRDSLQRHSNVCNGCFKTLYTLSVTLALELGVQYIVTGLSRGQLFETRLAHLYKTDAYDESKIESDILRARLIYHRMDDAVSRLLDTRCFQDDGVFERVAFLDFYRYVDVRADEIYRYLEQEVGWVRPADTGRSTNCLINNTGIFVHNRERGYHNYSLPYSWDVRLGHKSRDEAMRELNDLSEISTSEVQRMVREVGFDFDTSAIHRDVQLVGYYICRSELAPEALRQFLLGRLPEYMVPAYFMRLDRLPLTSGGKVNRRALPTPVERPRSLTCEYVAPETETQRLLARIWSDVLNVQKIGVRDNFFDLGGNSLPAALLLFRIAQRFHVVIPGEEFARMPTVGQLAAYLDRHDGVGAVS